MCPVVLFFKELPSRPPLPWVQHYFTVLCWSFFGSPYFSSTLLLSSSVAAICVHTIFEVADDVGERRDLTDDRGV